MQDVKKYIHIKDIAEETGLSIREVHFLEEIGLIKSIEQLQNKKSRYFLLETVQIVNWIIKLQKLSFSWVQIRKITENWGADDKLPLYEFFMEIIQEKLEQLQNEINKLQDVKDKVQKQYELLEKHKENMKDYFKEGLNI